MKLSDAGLVFEKSTRLASNGALARGLGKSEGRVKERKREKRDGEAGVEDERGQRVKLGRREGGGKGRRVEQWERGGMLKGEEVVGSWDNGEKE